MTLNRAGRAVAGFRALSAEVETGSAKESAAKT
jgi:hypothetical protein